MYYENSGCPSKDPRKALRKKTMRIQLEEKGVENSRDLSQHLEIMDHTLLAKWSQK